MNTKPRIELLQKIVIGLFPTFARLVRQQALFKTPNSPPGFLCARSLNCAPLMSSTHTPLFMAAIAGNVTPSFTISPFGSRYPQRYTTECTKFEWSSSSVQVMQNSSKSFCPYADMGGVAQVWLLRELWMSSLLDRGFDTLLGRGG